MPTAASNDQTYRSLPCPNGCCLSAGRRERRNAVSSSTSVTESPTECAASDSSAADPVNRPAKALSTAMPTLAASARRTVTTLSSAAGEAACSGMADAGEDRLRLRHGQRAAVAGERAAAGTLQAPAVDQPAGVDRRPAEIADEPRDHRLGLGVVPSVEERQRLRALPPRADGPGRQAGGTPHPA